MGDSAIDIHLVVERCVLASPITLLASLLGQHIGCMDNMHQNLKTHFPLIRAANVTDQITSTSCLIYSVAITESLLKAGANAQFRY